MSNLVLTATSTDAILAKKIANKLHAGFVPLEITSFANGEISVHASDLLAGKTVILLHQSISPIHEKIIQLSLAMNAIRNRQPNRLLVLLPYFPYSRQDKLNPGGAIGAAVMAQLIQASTPDAVFTLDLHAVKIMDYCHFPLKNIASAPLFTAHIQQKFSLQDICLVSPDAGGIERTRKIAEILAVPFISLIKQRLESGKIEVQLPSPLPEKKIFIFIDDIIDTGATLLTAAAAFPPAQQKHVYATHGVFSDAATYNKFGTCFDSISVTNSLNPHISQSVDLQLQLICCSTEFAAAVTYFLANS